ncbi:crotonobetainyl-CoA--carnitine CoA-transferase [Flavobacterium enshiense]|uniref:Crotonobetainyl-CoA:carnitine CoA-transferase n=1 Tax=Flavobacterium enshiense DK69 TaxID=1107311 RepID=A0A0A2N0J3_9FLAO|nr:crotonobetainyl-CoA--carnitine CoA-transferase [Flavobacterium enshiense]KGO97188.1 crotonobetainyl-CoA:carnitine CoA-transferase [Flavobacterium enshiense DK69]
MVIEIKSIASLTELENRNKLNYLFNNCPIPDDERLANSGLFVKRQDLTKQLFFNDLYSKFIGVHGVIMEFGVRWGQNLVTLNNLRGIHEPFNYSRKIIGFDTFTGFANVSEKDGNHKIIKKGAFSVTNEYEKYLDEVLDYHEKECPVSHIKKNILIKGDAVEMLEKYLEEHPETIIAFAYFDFDVYEPTKKCLELIKPYLTKGSIIGFDELNDPQFPGETVALKESLGLNNVAIKRSKYSGIQSYFEFL